jgi:hypothetical protein
MIIPDFYMVAGELTETSKGLNGIVIIIEDGNIHGKLNKLVCLK